MHNLEHLRSSTFKDIVNLPLNGKGFGFAWQVFFELTKRKRYDCPDCRFVKRSRRTHCAPVEVNLFKIFIFHVFCIWLKGRIITVI